MTDSGRTIGVIPAAGHASRLQPLTGSKEMIAARGCPIVQFLLDGLERGGCEEIRLVTRPEKQDLVAYAQARGVNVVLGTPASVSESLLSGIDDLDSEDVVLVGFPDTIWEPDDALASLSARLVPPAEIVLGLFEVSADADCDRVRLGPSAVVLGIDVKPSRPESTLTWGCFAARASLLRGLEAPEPGDYFDSLCPSDRVVGLTLSDRYLDIGTRAGLDRLETWFDRASELGSARERCAETRQRG